MPLPSVLLEEKPKNIEPLSLQVKKSLGLKMLKCLTSLKSLPCLFLMMLNGSQGCREDALTAWGAMAAAIQDLTEGTHIWLKELLLVVVVV